MQKCSTQIKLRFFTSVFRYRRTRFSSKRDGINPSGEPGNARRSAGRSNKQIEFVPLFVCTLDKLWWPHTHRGEDSLRLDMQPGCSARGEHLVLVLAGLPQGEAFIEMRCQGERVPETDMHRNRLSLKGCCYGKRGLQKQLKTETEWILQGCCCLQK